jgi:NAD(P)-dependent dehydrogenase (short-subunit alcohol dehydrogenase family)
LVTGAAGAIGRAVVELLVERGERVVAHDLRSVTAATGAVTSVSGDLLDPADRAALRDAVGDDLTCAIATHGIDGAAALNDITPEFARRAFDVNFTSVVALFETTLPALRAAGGRFVAVSSQAGLVGEADNIAYSAAKFALVGWASELASTLAHDGVGIHLLCPGCTESPLLYDAQERFARARGAATEDEVRDFVGRRAAGIPVGRFATAAETAATAVYLAIGPGPRPVVLAETGGEVPW